MLGRTAFTQDQAILPDPIVRRCQFLIVHGTLLALSLDVAHKGSGMRMAFEPSSEMSQARGVLLRDAFQFRLLAERGTRDIARLLQRRRVGWSANVAMQET